MDNPGYDLEIAKNSLKDSMLCEGIPPMRLGKKQKEERENMLSEETKQLIADTRANMANLWERMYEMETCHDKLRKERNELRDEVARLKRILKSKESDIAWIYRTDTTVDEWEQKTLDFIRENEEDIGDRFCAPRNQPYQSNMCLERIQQYGWKLNPEQPYNEMTEWLHLIKDE